MSQHLELPKSYYLYVECIPYYTVYRYPNGRLMEIPFMKMEIFYKGSHWFSNPHQFIFLS